MIQADRQMTKWIHLYPQIPEDGQVVFVCLDDFRIFIGQCTYIGENDLGADDLMFYLYQVNTYLTAGRVTHYVPVILPQPPRQEND